MSNCTHPILSKLYSKGGVNSISFHVAEDEANWTKDASEIKVQMLQNIYYCYANHPSTIKCPNQAKQIIAYNKKSDRTKTLDFSL